MFIVCSNCDFKYLVNSADLKPNGRMVECANCSHKWFQELDNSTSYPIPSLEKNELNNNIENNDKKSKSENKQIKNLPSTIVREEKPSVINSTMMIVLVLIIISGLWFYKSYGTNTFVLVEFYVKEFFFNLNLIFSDLAIVIHKTLN